jgi:hypothetical protein
MRRGAILSIHSSELVVKAIQHVGGDIRFEHQSDLYRTGWIGDYFRIVVSRTMAEGLYAAHQCMSSLMDMQFLY